VVFPGPAAQKGARDRGLRRGFGGFKGDGELLFGLGLADELAKPTRAQFEFKTLLFISARGADEAFWSVIAGNGHAASSVAGWGCGCNRRGCGLKLEDTLRPPPACSGSHEAALQQG